MYEVVKVFHAALRIKVRRPARCKLVRTAISNLDGLPIVAATMPTGKLRSESKALLYTQVEAVFAVERWSMWHATNDLHRSALLIRE